MLRPGPGSILDHRYTSRILDVMTTTEPGVSSGAGRPVHSISFKCNDGQFMRADALRATFEPATWALAFRWLLEQPEVHELIRKRVSP